MSQAWTGTYTVTAALPYANGPIHIGHIAGVYLPADIYTRYLRSTRQRVVFVCGSDEHGVPITISAMKAKTTPQNIVDEYHVKNREAFKTLGISFDIFSRTSLPQHHQMATAFFSKLVDQGDLILQNSIQYYDPTQRLFLADRYIQGTCPKCHFDSAYGDQCEACGTTLNPTDLLNPHSVLSQAKPVLKPTKHWYLRLDKYQKWLEAWTTQKKGHWKNNVYSQCQAWLDQGLQPRAVTRDLDWGVPVPGSKGKVLYVWFEAPIGYITATKIWATNCGQDWRPFWQDPRTKLVHFVGKDNIVFHCIVFPTMLKAHGDYILPHNVPSNEFLNLEGKKISTSRQWAVWLHEYLEKYPDKQDVLRYVLCANTPETKDSNFTWKDFKDKHNSDLVGILANFVYRTLVLTHRYFQGRVPSKHTESTADHEVYCQLQQIPQRVGTAITQYKFREALNAFMSLPRIGNKYLATTAPWASIGRDNQRASSILYTALQIVAHIALIGIPFLPFTCQRLSNLLRLPELYWDQAGRTDLLPAGHELQQPYFLFEKITDWP